MAEVANGLNLFLKLRNPAAMPQLLAAVAVMQPRIRAALHSLHYVHFARFVPTPDQSTLIVITEFDGELRNYVMDFAAVVGDEFTRILEFVQDAPPLPVQAHPREFWEFIDRCSRPHVPLWSAYPDKTVLDILGPRRAAPLAYADALPARIDLADVQGNILRGYPATCAQHFMLAVTDAAAARAFIGQLVDGVGTAPQLRITTAESWDDPVAGKGSRRPSHFVNLGFTHLGLQALGVPAVTLRSFPESFRMGPAAPGRAPQNGDIGDSDPRRWAFGGPDTAPVHAMLSLFACSDEVLAQCCQQLNRLLDSGSGLATVYVRDARALPDGQVHFGYKDGIAQPHVAGSDAPAKRPDLQPAAHAGDFLLGKDYLNQAGGNFLDRLPPELCANGTYAAVRMMDQDVQAFYKLLDDVARQHRLNPKLVAAKLMGRWPSGAPLSLHPDEDGGKVPADRVNRFDYTPTQNHPGVEDDVDGLRCPVGSHIRRMNPRSALVTGKPYGRRIIRRGMPYGRAYDPRDKTPADEPRRGLFGLFICGDLEHQFEFLLHVWANSDIAAPGLHKTQDPIIGSQSLGGLFRFHVPDRDEPIEVTVPRLVHTAGSVYLFLPGIAGLRHLAALRPEQPPVPQPVLPDLARFDPSDPAFLENPYPFYKRFRDEEPVYKVGGLYKSHWVFSRPLVQEVLERDDVFLKTRHEPLAKGTIEDVVQDLPNGLFFMDPPRHTQVRSRLDPLFLQAIDGIGPKVKERARELIAQLQRKPAADLVQDYAYPLTLRAFCIMFGIPPTHEPVVGNWVNAALAANNLTAPLDVKAVGLTARLALGSYFQARRRGMGCPVSHPGLLDQPDLLSRMRAHADEHCTGDKKDLSAGEFQQTAAHFALGGFLSTQFLLVTGVLNLLRHPDQLERLRTTPSLLPGAVQEMLRYDAPFQLTDRYVASPCQLGGKWLAKGDKVTMVFGSANRDGPAGAAPDRFDIGRTPGPELAHFSLGGGIHRCIGAPMVEIVAPIAVWELIDGLPGLTAADGRQWQKDPYFRSLSLFPLRW